MATKIQNYYLQAGEIGGIEARAKLTMLTSINSYQAVSIPDSDENIKIFETAMKKIVKDFNKEKSSLNSLRLSIFQLLVGNKAS